MNSLFSVNENIFSPKPIKEYDLTNYLKIAYVNE